LRFFKRVSGTRIWSAVGTLLFRISLLSRIQCMEKSAEWELQLKRGILAVANSNG
jgi:hypothetical protein